MALYVYSIFCCCLFGQKFRHQRIITKGLIGPAAEGRRLAEAGTPTEYPTQEPEEATLDVEQTEPGDGGLQRQVKLHAVQLSEP